MTAREVSEMPWELWRKQVWAIVSMEWRRSFFSRRALWIYLLALAPLALAVSHSLVMLHRGHWGHTLGTDTTIYAGIFHFYFVRVGIFFGCVGIFTNLFRGEVLAQTLHYYFLTPVRREVLVVGKYLTGLVATTVIFTISVGATYVAMLAHFGAGFRELFFNGPGMSNLFAFVSTAALACVGYGSVFLLCGLLIRNPMIPAAVVMVWEGINNFLPSVLQKISVVYYLKSISPMDVPEKGPFALFAIPVEPAPAWLAVTGLIVFSIVMLLISSLRVRKFQISYSE
jgi:ABC-type transport system involved in multi-copper enzyme maturation permease subunit